MSDWKGNRPGRPPLDAKAPSAAVHLKLRAEDFDRADRLAKQKRISIQEVIRRGLQKFIADERSGHI